MNILVLGGTKFLGKRLVEQLTNKGYKVTLLNRGTKSNIFSNLRTIIADRNKSVEVKRGLKNEKFDIIFDISGFTKENIVTILNCLDTSKIKQYIFCSSAAVFSRPPGNWPITENHSKCFLKENGNYAYEKLMAEECLLKQRGLNFSIVRPTYIYGPFDYSRRLVYIFERIITGKKVLIKGNGKNILQLCYVDDLVLLMISMIDNKVSFNEDFNVGGDDKITLEDLIHVCAHILDEEVKIEFNSETNEETCSFPNFDYFVGTDKVKDELGFQTTNLQKGLEETVRWWKKQTVI